MKQKITLALFFLFIACIGLFPPLKKDEKTMGRGFVLSQHLYQHNYHEWADIETDGTRFTYTTVELDFRKMFAEIISIIGIFGLYFTIILNTKNLRTKINSSDGLQPAQI